MKLSFEDRLQARIEKFLASDTLKKMEQGENYYKGKHDILTRQKLTIDPNGDLVPIYNAPNYKLVDNQFRGLLDQKVNYLLSKPLAFDSDNEKYIESLSKILNGDFLRTLFLLGKDAYKFGLGWLYVYYNEEGELSFKRFDSREIIPVWVDKDHTELDYVIRVYSDVKEEEDFQYIKKVEVYTKEGVKYYEYSGSLVKTEEKSYMSVKDKHFNWKKLPIIPFKVNSEEQPLLDRVKSIQDAINEVMSDYKNDMEQNWRNTIFVVKGYNPEGGRFRHNLSVYGVVGLEGDGASVETITVEVNSDNYETILRLFRKAMIENAKGFDAKNERMGNSPNEMNIQSMYSDIDLDANSLEMEFQYSLRQVIWFVNQYLGNEFSEERIDIIFNRDIMINESQAILDCVQSQNLISLETLLSQHPWVKNSKLELQRIKKQETEFLENQEQFKFKEESVDNDNREKVATD